MNWSHPDAHDPIDARDAERVAAEWSLRLQHGLSPTEADHLARWLRLDPRHAAILREMDETSRLLDQLRDPLLAGERSSPRSVIEFQPAEATPVRVARKWKAWMLPAGLAAAAAIVVGMRLQLSASRSDSFSQVAATKVGDWRTLNLPDGSVVQLNTDSAVDVRYTPAERRVRLIRGEAFFTVASNPSRPFWVEARTLAVRAVGTAFNVRHRPEAIEVVVTEGKVRLDSPASALVSEPSAGATNIRGEVTEPAETGSTAGPLAPQLLRAGQKAIVAVAGEARNPTPAIAVAVVELPRAGRPIAWQERRLEFADIPLKEWVAEFNRYNRHKLVIADPALENLTLGGAFNPYGYEGFVEILQQSFAILAERRKHETILRSAR